MWSSNSWPSIPWVFWYRKRIVFFSSCMHFFHYKLQSQVSEDHEPPSKSSSSMTQNFAASSLYIWGEFVLSLYIWGEFYLQLGATLLKWMNALLVSQEELFHPLICSNLKGRAANGNFFLPYPAPVPNSSTLFLCSALLQHFGFPLDRKVTSDLVSKGSYLFIKMLSGQYSAGIGSQAGFSCKLLALCSIAWSWQGIYCNFEHPVRQQLSFRSHPDFSGIKGQNSPLDKNISS